MRMILICISAAVISAHYAYENTVYNKCIFWGPDLVDYSQLNGEPYEKAKTRASRPNGRNRQPDHDGGHETLDLARIPNI